MSPPACVAILGPRGSGRGRACGRPARHRNARGEPVCGFHEPAALAARIARLVPRTTAYYAELDELED